MGVAIAVEAGYAASLITFPGGSPTTRRQKDPLRPPTSDERDWLGRIARSQAEPAAHVARAKALLAVADGASYTGAAKAAGRRSNDAVSNLVSRFNREGLAAIEPRHGGGPPVVYAGAERGRILEEARRKPGIEADGTASWSLMTLRRALRGADDGLPGVSTHTIHKTLKEAGLSLQKDRSWCETGVVERRRSGEVVTVVDPDAQAKKSWSSAPTPKGRRRIFRCGRRTRRGRTRPSRVPERAGSPPASRNADPTSTCAGGRPSS